MGYYLGDCNYAAGDYYRGDYYRGDPGLLGNLLKGIGGAVKGFVTGGPLGAISGGVRAFAGKPGTAMVPTNGARRPLVEIGGRVPFTDFGTSFALGPGVGPGAPGVPAVGIDSNGRMCLLKGTRLNKSSYFKATSPGANTAIRIPKGSVCVKTRRINVANPRALRRAVRRAQGFAKMARRVLTFVSAKAPKGRPKFKRAR